METDQYGIPIVHRDSAEEFLKELDELQPRWNKGRWIFRGHNDADWTLLAPTMRQSFFDDFVVKYVLGDDPYAMVKGEFTQILRSDMLVDHPLYRLTMHALTEMLLIQTFIELSDRSGLSVPHERIDNIAILQDLMKQAEEFQHHKYNPDQISIRISEKSVYYALAQHHRIPTRLLDFTRRPLVASFFASAMEEELDGIPTRCAVWAVDVGQLEATSLSLVRHRMSLIGFLQAQDGLFLYDTLADEKWLEGDNVHWIPFEAELQNLVVTDGVFKITLPFTERENLLKVLLTKQIAKPMLMPSFDNVAEAVNDNLRQWTDYVK